MGREATTMLDLDWDCWDDWDGDIDPDYDNDLRPDHGPANAVQYAGPCDWSVSDVDGVTVCESRPREW